MKKGKRVFNFKDIIIIVVITSLIMCFLGATFMYKHLNGSVLLNSKDDLAKFISAYSELTTNYYGDLDKSEIIDGAIDGMYSVVDDPYTSYLDEENSDSLSSTLSGEYEGIGISIFMNDENKIIVSDVYENTPAYKAGILKNDVITKINETTIENLSTSEVASLIKNNENNKVTLECMRGEEILTFEMNVESLNVPVVSTEIYNRNDKKIGYIRLTVFSNTSDSQFINALNELEKEGINSLIIDLRSNLGGYLDSATNIAEVFLEKSKVIYSLQNNDGIKHYKDTTKEKRDYKIVVLINGSTASASEILASALKYSYGATIVGTQSYGKGKVQELSSVDKKTSVKYTTALWLTPIDTCIDGEGLNPDIQVELDIENYDASNSDTDNQLQSALNSLQE